MAKKKSELETENLTRMLQMMGEKHAGTEWRRRIEAERRKADIDRMIEAKVSQALRLMV